MYMYVNDPSVRLTGRWSRDNINLAVATAAGSYFEFAFCGEMALIHFDMSYCTEPAPHLWIQVDGGAMVETALAHHLRVRAQGCGNHVVKVIFKSGVEGFHRWFAPLDAKVAFKGVEADAPGVLPEDSRKIVEFVGDSITEGVLIDPDYSRSAAYPNDVYNRVYQNDVCATYAWLTAEKLNLRPIMMGYGAVGTTRSGSGNVPPAAIAYPQVFDGCPYTGEHPDIVVINHGANDRGVTADRYIASYSNLVDLIHHTHPAAAIVCLGAFCGAFASELKAFVETYNAAHDQSIYFIDSTGWVPLEPLHPLRGGHSVIAEHVAAEMKRMLNL